MSQDKKRTQRGFRIFAEASGIRVLESSLALEGPHARIYGGRDQEGHIHLTVKQAKTAILGLEAFVREAEAGKLTERIEEDGR